MKPRLPELLALLLWGVSLAGTSAQVSDTPPPLGAPTTAPVAEVATTPVPPAPRDAKGKPAKVVKPPKVRQQKEIPFPLPIGDTGRSIKIPQHDGTGALLQQLFSLKMTHVDNEHVEMHEATIDLYHPDGKEDFHVLLPDSILNLKTQVITSDHPVTVRTEDFELTGERMKFNTVDRTGELQGHVHMVIHNFKQVAGVIPTAPASK